MARLFIYLLESGICLSIFYLGYVLLFRKETFFLFNRAYLISSLVLSLIVPLMHYQVSSGHSAFVNRSAENVTKFKDYYEHLIYMTDPGYMAEEASVTPELGSTKPNLGDTGRTSESSSINLLNVFAVIYFCGSMFFVVRFFIRLYGLIRLAKKNKTENYHGVKLVLLNEELPSFSFFKWVFINKELLSPGDFRKVLEHEKVHIEQRHSLDLAIVQIFAIVQWFNPLAWRLHKSLKTCHEYIADSKVVERGHELFDYQSLLLGQLISIRSVELVNNFNLLSIKKRIAMMNKNKSKRVAMLKALLIVPLLVGTFLLFSDMIIISEGNGKEDLVGDRMESKVDSGENKVQKVWIVKPEEKSYYPKASQVREFDQDMILFTLEISNEFVFEDKKRSSSELKDLICKKADDGEALPGKGTVLLKISKEAKMEIVDEVKYILRKYNFLKIGYFVAEKCDVEGKKRCAIFQKLPPMDAPWADETKLKKEGVELLVINKTNNNTEELLDKNLRALVRSGKKYVLRYEYDNETSYNDYIYTTDIVYRVINEARREYAASQGKVFEELSKEEQREIRFKYPITLTQLNTDRGVE